MTPVIVLTSVAAAFDARPLARELVEQRLAGCVNIVPGVTSIFRWKGALEEDGEQILVIKTLGENIDALRDALLARHPYEVAEFLVIRAEAASAAYSAWLVESASR